MTQKPPFLGKHGLVICKHDALVAHTASGPDNNKKGIMSVSNQRNESDIKVPLSISPCHDSEATFNVLYAFQEQAGRKDKPLITQHALVTVFAFVCFLKVTKFVDAEERKSYSKSRLHITLI